jgi:hypothetical protein
MHIENSSAYVGRMIWPGSGGSQLDPVRRTDERGGSQGGFERACHIYEQCAANHWCDKNVFNFVLSSVNALRTIGFLERGVAVGDDR